MRLSFLIVFVFLLQHVSAQEYKYIIHLRDKNNTGFNLNDPNAFLSEKSIQRRLKYKIVLDSTDLPVSASYVDSITLMPSVRVLNKSKWFNQVLISVTDTSMLHQILNFPFVNSYEAVNKKQLIRIKGKISENKQDAFHSSHSTDNIKSISGFSASDYGASYNQIHIHHGEFLHDQGFKGEGMLIAILDNGFNNYLGNPAFASIRNSQRIFGTYDFVHQKISVNEEGAHGADCFSIIASNLPAVLIGSAPAAAYLLLKTEDDASESPTEEQNWVAGAEYADSAGADLISTSLGYSYFDDSVYDLHYAQRDGHTSLVTQAANMAVAKGMIVTASAGNSGKASGEAKYIGCPADGDSVYAVGAVSQDGQIAGFSSPGPNASGQVKPDGVSVGAGTFFISTDGKLYAGNGTSFSNPNLAGLITCLWQAFPEFRPADILSAVKNSSDKFQSPENDYGYGIPDFQKAYQALMLKKIAFIDQLTDEDWIRVFPVPFVHSLNVFVKPGDSGVAAIELLNVAGKTILKNNFTVRANENQLLQLTVSGYLSKGVYYIRYTDKKRTKTVSILKK